MKTKKGFYIMLCGMMAACMPQGVVRHDMQALPEEGWRRQDTVSFDIDSTHAGCELRLCLRVNSATLPYDTIYLRVDGDTLTVPIKSMAGTSLKQGELTLGTAHPGRYDIIHLMRRDPLPGVHEVGIKLKRDK